MTRDDILSAARLIRPLLRSQLLMHTQCDPGEVKVTERLHAALKAFDGLVTYATEAQARQASDLTGHLDEDDLDMEPGAPVAPPNEDDDDD